MTNEEKKALDPQSLDVTELEDESLEDVAGGDNSGCNTNCPCQPGGVTPQQINPNS
jgi:hypothetical protein